MSSGFHSEERRDKVCACVLSNNDFPIYNSFSLVFFFIFYFFFFYSFSTEQIMGNLQSTPEYYNGNYDYTGYQSELERYYYYRRMMYAQYYPNAITATTGYTMPVNYYNSYYQPSLYQSPYYNSTALGYGTYPYGQSLYSPYSYSSPMYGYNSYYPNYNQRTYM